MSKRKKSLATGAELIAAERRRHQEEEGWSESHDAEHDLGELAKAAACYAIPARSRRLTAHETISGKTVLLPCLWPWDYEWWKPTPDDRIRELVKAGALIAAEIDRLQRSKSRKLRHIEL